MVRIANLTNRLVSLRLNNGKTLHLPPHTASAELIEAQVTHNAKVAKLRDRHIIALSETRAKGAEDTSRGRGPRASKSSKTSPSGSSTEQGE